MKTYSSIEQIEQDLKVLSLERQIAKEEIKMLKGKLKEDLKPLNWINSALKTAGKLSIMVILKRIIR